MRSPRVRGALAYVVLLLFGVFLAAELPGQAQPIRPVVTQTSQDGRLVGLETDLPPLQERWKPIAALAYGFDSGRFRYQGGLELRAGRELPGVGDRVSDPSLAIVDWPQSPILGREGQRGVRAGLRVGSTRATGFFGRLWPREDAGNEGPTVGYLRVDTSETFKLPYRIQARTRSTVTVGALTDGTSLGATFRANTGSLQLHIDDVRARLAYGSLTNEADLAGFRFTTGVPGLSALEGDRYWRATLRRTLPMYTTSIAIPLPPEFAGSVPNELPVRLEGDLGAHLAQAQADEKTRMRFSWTAAVTLSVRGLALELELVVPQDGSAQVDVSF